MNLKKKNHLKLLHYGKKFCCLPVKEKLLFAEALFFLFLAKLMLLVLPFRVCIQTIRGRKYAVSMEAEKLYLVKYAVSRANRLAFWGNVCLVQSLAARWMLQRRKINSSFSIGIKHDSTKKVTAHAWLVAGNNEIVPKGKDYTPITVY